MMFLAMNVDHRVLDGSDAARMLNTLKTYIENPGALLQ
jgi:pyruvate/2-oxoglutarate dehydrogenase complex dihydrolipoamide acyltransferase (E2) component